MGKSGKFVNPTDKARKEARKKELKKNKNKRQLVRTAVLKGKDPNQLIAEMEDIDKMEYNVNEPPALSEQVLKERRRKLQITFHNVMRLYEKEDKQKWADMKRLEKEYNTRRIQHIQFYESVKRAQQVQITDIPLPDMPYMNNFRPQPVQIPLPPPIVINQPKLISKEPILYVTNQRKGPGVPPGPPPELSDYEDDEENELNVKESEEKQLESFYSDVSMADTAVDDNCQEMAQELEQSENEMRACASSNAPEIHFKPPPLPGRPPGPPPGLPPGINSAPVPSQWMIQQPPLPNVYQYQQPASNVLSAPPSLISRAKIQDEKKKMNVSIKAKPKLRNLRNEATQFMPTSLRIKREEKRVQSKSTSLMGLKSDPMVSIGPQLPGSTKTDAYDQFMKEMQGFM